MQPLQQQQTRINLSDLRAQIVKKLGPDRSNQYFYYLNRLLNQKLSKTEFNKYCFRALGRENLPLHNQLIRSILSNACNATVPPPVHEKEAPAKSNLKRGKKPPSIEDRFQQNGLSQSQNQGPPLFRSNGDVLPTSPRKIRSGIPERRPRDHLDRPSPLGPNGKTGFLTHQSTIPNNGNAEAPPENGTLNSCDLRRLVHYNYQELAERPETELDESLQHPAKRPRTKKSLENGPVSVHSKGPVTTAGAAHVEGREDSGRTENSISTKSPLSAPLGIPFCSASVGGARRVLPVMSSSSFASSSDTGELPDIETLRKRMEQIAGAQGLEHISTDCANLLKNGLDGYLKRLIRSCFELVGARTGHEPTKSAAYNQQPQRKLLNGMHPGQQLQMQNSVGSMERVQEPRAHGPISLLDFKVAMELKPQQLGEDWPLLLERICLHSYDE